MTYSIVTSSGRTQLVACDETVLGEWNASDNCGEARKNHAREVGKLHAEDSSRTEEKMEWSVSVKESVERWERESRKEEIKGKKPVEKGW